MAISPLTAAAATKNEIVYVNLKADGRVEQINVVNRFDGMAAGERIADYGAYSKVVNLTDLTDIAQDGDEISFITDSDTFYYQGKLTRPNCPWLFDIRFRLNGKAVTAEDLAGASGRFEMDLSTRRNTAVDDVFFDHYTLQMTVTLDTARCRDIRCDAGTQANSGKDRLITLTIMPDTEQDAHISADVTDFEMAAVTANGVPLNIDVDAIDTSDLKDQVTDLQDGIDKLDDGAGTLRKAVRKLGDGAGELYANSEKLDGAIGQLSGGSASLVTGSAQMRAAIDALNAQLGNASGGGSASGAEQLVAGYKAISAQLGSITGDFAQLMSASASVKQMIDGLDASGGHADDIGVVRDAIHAVESSKYAGELSAYTAAGKRVCAALEKKDADAAAIAGLQKAYAGVDAGVQSLSSLTQGITVLKDKLDALNDNLEKALSALDGSGMGDLKKAVAQMAAAYPSLDDGIQALSKNLGSLDTQYGKFHSGVGALSEGMGKLTTGTRKLDRGTGELRDETSDMDTKIDDEVDKALEKFDNSDFAPVSFVDARNQVALVQFVIKSQSVEKPEEDAMYDDEEEPRETIIDKFLKLFSGGETA